jgi:hypothetical protein
MKERKGVHLVVVRAAFQYPIAGLQGHMVTQGCHRSEEHILRAALRGGQRVAV